MSLVMGTAGHIDHGKTSLIRALTGINCDRLEEEQKRGITIELGFAYFDLPEKDGIVQRMGIIDVPGHERFVRNMVAGASGIDFVLLVIAADEGVMPQTREHLEICSLLNITHGMIALTKIDTVDQDLLELAIEDVQDFVKGSFLENAPIFPVSSLTQEGLPELKNALIEQNKNLHPKRRSDIFRLPVDRVFTLKGHGTLVTGTLLSGSAVVGDAIELLPKGLSSRIRSIQNHGKSVDKAYAGNRTSINLSDLNVSDISRGDILALPNTLFTSTKWIVALTCLKSSPRALRHRSEIHFHHNTKDVMARLFFYGKDKLNPGETALCEVRFSEPLTGIFGDMCVLRSFSPLQTVAGAVIINPFGDDFPKRSLVSIEWQEKLLALHLAFSKIHNTKNVFREVTSITTENVSKMTAQLKNKQNNKSVKNQAEIVAKTSPNIASKTTTEEMPPKNTLLLSEQDALYIQIYFGQPYGIEQKKLALLTSLDTKKLEKFLQTLVTSKQICIYDKEKKVAIAEEYVSHLAQSFLATIAKYHTQYPLKPSMPKASLFFKACPAKLNYFILERLAKQGFVILEEDGVRLTQHMVTLKEDERALKANIITQFNKNENNPPLLKELCDTLKANQKEVLAVLQILIQENYLIKITDGMYFKTQFIEQIKTDLYTFFQTNTSLTPPDFKTISHGLSRKYSIPILEFFDKERFTIRVADGRQLRKTS